MVRRRRGNPPHNVIIQKIHFAARLARIAVAGPCKAE